MEKLEKKKHDHTLTKWLKFGIFAVIMVAPFLNVLARTMYVVVNKNAKESYYGQTINEYIDTRVNGQYKTDTTYYLSNKNIDTTNNSGYLYINNFEIYNRDNLSDYIYNIINNNKDKIARIRIYKNNNIDTISMSTQENAQSTYQYLVSYTTAEFNPIYSFRLDNATDNAQNNLYYREYNKYSFLDNVFEYSINKLKEDNLYNWSTQTGIYTAINNMTSGLGANDVLAMLLAYWGILTAIYIVFDIVIECFTKLTHMLTD